MMTEDRRTKLKRLVTLANFLDDLPHSKFHMPTWVSPDATETSCGTAGCACGWAATIFNKLGWKILNKSPTVIYNIDGIEFGASQHHGFARFFDISLSQAYYITSYLFGDKDVAQLTFRGITRGWVGEDLVYLDTKVSYKAKYRLASEYLITPQHAADRIREVIREIDPTLLDEPVEVIKFKDFASCELAKT